MLPAFLYFYHAHRAKPSQVPSLPRLVAPWQHEETTPNRPHPKPHTSTQPVDPLANKALPSSNLHPEQINLLGSLGGDQNEGDSDGERGRRGAQEALERLAAEITSHLRRLEERTSQNEQRILREETQMSSLIQLAQETERRVLDIQRQLVAKRDEQGASLEGVRERLNQVEQRQLQLANFSQQSQEGLAAQLRRVGEEMGTLKSRVEKLSGSVGGKMSALDHRQSALVRTYC